MTEVAEIADLIVDDKTRGIFRVRRSAFTAQAVFEMERHRVFERCWLYLAHASEVESPGSFVARTVAGRPINRVTTAIGSSSAVGVLTLLLLLRGPDSWYG